jgi:hypothetical protein
VGEPVQSDSGGACTVCICQYGTRRSKRTSAIFVSWFSVLLNRIFFFVLLFKPLVFWRNCYGIFRTKFRPNRIQSLQQTFFTPVLKVCSVLYWTVLSSQLFNTRVWRPSTQNSTKSGEKCRKQDKVSFTPFNKLRFQHREFSQNSRFLTGISKRPSALDVRMLHSFCKKQSKYTEKLVAIPSKYRSPVPNFMKMRPTIYSLMLGHN